MIIPIGGFNSSNCRIICKLCKMSFKKKGQNNIFCSKLCQKNFEKDSWKRYVHTYRTKFPERYLLRAAKSRALKYNLSFTIDEEDIKIPKFCPILGLVLEVGSSIRGNPCSASLDRIDNSKDYIKGNVQVISLLANQMKSSATPEQLRMFAKWVNLNV